MKLSRPYPNAEYLAQVIETTLTQEMRIEARFLKANVQARSAIKQFLEAPDNELDEIIRSIWQNWNALSNQLCKRYPKISKNVGFGERIVYAVQQALAVKKMATGKKPSIN